jgi:hypothetical protein
MDKDAFEAVVDRLVNLHTTWEAGEWAQSEAQNLFDTVPGPHQRGG